MSQILKPLFAVALGVALGLAATWLAVDRGVEFAAARAGPWLDFPKAGSLEADPYTRAIRARSGETPLGIAEGLTFLARVDDAGAPLDARCDYAVSSPTPAARFWTLTALSPEGRPLDGSMQSELTSSNIVRASSGDFSINVAREARPGNWIQIVAGRPFLLMFRLYDTPVSAAASALDVKSMPSIRRGRCA